MIVSRNHHKTHRVDNKTRRNERSTPGVDNKTRRSERSTRRVDNKTRRSERSTRPIKRILVANGDRPIKPRVQTLGSLQQDFPSLNGTNRPHLNIVRRFQRRITMALPPRVARTSFVYPRLYRFVAGGDPEFTTNARNVDFDSLCSLWLISKKRLRPLRSQPLGYASGISAWRLLFASCSGSTDEISVRDVVVKRDDTARFIKEEPSCSHRNDIRLASCQARYGVTTVDARANRDRCRE